MSEIGIEKFLANELAKPPFELDFNVASFSSLTCQEMIHLLALIMTEIDADQAGIDLSGEDERTTLTRVIEFLRVLKYQPHHDDPHIVRDGILNGDPDFLVPVMAWMLSRKEELKIRAYLAKYLVRIPIPDEEWWADVEVDTNYRKYEALLDDFKGTHKEYLKLKDAGNSNSTTALLTDMQNMEHDIECIQRKLDGMKFRMNESGQTPSMLKCVHDLRMASLKVEEFADQERNEEQICDELENQKLELHNTYLEECNNTNLVSSGQELLDRAIEENNRLRTLVQEKGPYEDDFLKRKIHALELVDEQPPETQQHLNRFKDKVRKTGEQILELQNRKRIKDSSEELFVYRQKTSALLHKKKSLHAKMEPIVDRLTELRSHIDYVVQERNEKLMIASQREEEYLTYVQFIQSKESYCSKLESELAELRKETGILSSTRFIVDGQWRETEKGLEELEVQLGLSGFYEDPEKVLGFGKYTGPEFEEKKNRLYEMTKKVKELMDTVKAKQERLEPLLNDVQQAKQQEMLLQMEYDESKQKFETLRLSLENSNIEAQSRIAGLKTQFELEQFELVQLKCLLTQSNVTRFRVAQEQASQSLSMHGFRDKLTVKILEQERIQKQLEQERDELDQFVAYSNNQKQLWGNVTGMEKKLANGSGGQHADVAYHEYELGTADHAPADDGEDDYDYDDRDQDQDQADQLPYVNLDFDYDNNDDEPLDPDFFE